MEKSSDQSDNVFKLLIKRLETALRRIRATDLQAIGICRELNPDATFQLIEITGNRRSVNRDPLRIITNGQKIA